MRLFPVFIVCFPVLSLNNFELHTTWAMKNILIQEKSISFWTFNPGCAFMNRLSNHTVLMSQHHSDLCFVILKIWNNSVKSYLRQNDAVRVFSYGSQMTSTCGKKRGKNIIDTLFERFLCLSFVTICWRHLRRSISEQTQGNMEAFC